MDYSQNKIKKLPLSVIMITLNEAENLSACLASVADIAAEIVIVDGGSQDSTVAIAEKFGARVIVNRDWPGFGVQKNRALAQAREKWVLSLDADERLTLELRDEITRVISQENTAAMGYEIERRSWFIGQFIKHAWSADYVLRLCQREHARFTDDMVHERLIVDGRVARLKSVMLHYSYRNYEQVLKKIDHYSSLSAQQAYARGKRATIGTALLHGWWAFMRSYFIRRGFLDGADGLALAISIAEGSYYRYMKLRLLNFGKNNHSEK